MRILYLQCGMGASGDMLTSALAGLLTEEETEHALEMANDRNQTSHMYGEQMVIELVERIKGYDALMQRWYRKMKE